MQLAKPGIGEVVKPGGRNEDIKASILGSSGDTLCTSARHLGHDSLSLSNQAKCGRVAVFADLYCLAFNFGSTNLQTLFAGYKSH
jgi:hypothetical protein